MTVVTATGKGEASKQASCLDTRHEHLYPTMADTEVETKQLHSKYAPFSYPVGENNKAKALKILCVARLHLAVSILRGSRSCLHSSHGVLSPFDQGHPG